MAEQKIVIEITPPGGRLDQEVANHLPDISRNRIQRFIRSGLVLVDGEPVLKPGCPLKGGEWVSITIPAPQPSDLVPEEMNLNIVFEDEGVLVVDKPAGMVVHPSMGHSSGTLVQGVLAYAPELEGVGDVLRPGVVHRLDKDTSGLILFAKNDRAHQELQAQFKDREVEKQYLALVDGAPPTPSGKVDASIGRDQHHRQRMAVVPSVKGREAITTFHTMEGYPAHTLLDVYPQTGRTHQIRVHLAFVGCPIVGDTYYGNRVSTLDTTRHLLHAAQLKLFLPGREKLMTFQSPLPDDFERILEMLRIS